jgi:hypothetical protein
MARLVWRTLGPVSSSVGPAAAPDANARQRLVLHQTWHGIQTSKSAQLRFGIGRW